MAMTMRLIALLLVAQTVVLNGPLKSSAWVALEGRPSAEELECTYYSRLFWATSVKDGVPHVTEIPLREHFDPVPFQIAASRDRDGNRYVASVPDGFLVGFDDGEFGGGLWWFNHRGTESRRIRSDSAKVNSADPYQPENVVGLPIVGGERLVLMGLNHLTGRSGRIFRAVQEGTDWALALVAVLEGAPDVWFVDGNRLLFLTESGLWSTDPRGTTSRIYEVDLSGLSASAIVRAPDRGLYLGLRHYVLRLQESNGNWRETWYTPAGCRKVQIRLGECVCTG
jgi:hypothetical protein